MNSRKQGDVGTGYAVAYFLSQGYTVAIPMSDSQTYDLVIERKGRFNRVQCKTSFKKNKNGSYQVELRTISNTRGKKLEIRKPSKDNFDVLFVTDGDGNMYTFPSSEIDGHGSISLAIRQQNVVGKLAESGLMRHGANVVCP